MKNSKILVVDDEPSIRRLLQAVLEDEGHEVLCADSGNDAISLLGNEKVDLIISDIRMPNGSGIDLLNSLKEDSPPLIFITGFSEEVERKSVSGALAILKKPFDIDLMLEKVEQCLSQR